MTEPQRIPVPGRWKRIASPRQAAILSRGGPSSDRAGDRSAEVYRSLLFLGTLLWLVLTVLWLTWTPLQWSGEANRIVLFPHTSPFELAGNLLLLTPFGVMMALGGRRGLLVVGLASALLSFGVEMGQIFLLGRIVSITDILLNTLGAVGSGAVAMRLRPRFGARRIAIATGAAVFFVLVVFTIGGGILYDHAVRIAGWNPEFVVLTADEADGTKPFEGTVSHGQICAGGGVERICAYAGADPAVRRKLVEVAERSQTVDIYARFVSRTVDQWGPARIITFSESQFRRNITLAQEGSAMVLRIRTPLMGLNGKQYELWIPRAILPGQEMTAHVHYEHGAVVSTLQTAAATRIERHKFDALSSGLMIRGVGAVTPLQVSSARTLGAAILLLPLSLFGMAAAERRLGTMRWSGRNRRR
jgi:glycopeptide antibiotics resistance protein